MDGRYPAIEPFETGMLDVGDGHQLYWERSGNPQGRPAVVLHGGPGTGSWAGARRFFDPAAYQIVLCDQRGCGKSRPLLGDDVTALATHTTPKLVSDLEALRTHLGFTRWTIVGLSWGTTLGLAYAEAHPDRVDAMVLALVSTSSSREVRWITEDVGALFPHAWHAFADAVPRAEGERLIDAYAARLFDADPAVCAAAARAWCHWEDAHVSLAPGHRPSPMFDDAAFRLRFARLVTHYWRHAAAFGHDTSIENVTRLEGIPGVLLHGRYDVSSPLETAWQLSRRWTTSTLHVMDDAGHGGEALPGLIVAATDRLASR